jgi:predicted DNA-binding transcriptional regulator AlpA
MKVFSNNQAASKLGISPISLSRYVRAKKVPTPNMLQVGDSSLHAWTEAEIEHVRKLLPKIANGRKTRYKKAVSSQQSAVSKKKSKKK